MGRIIWQLVYCCGNDNRCSIIFIPFRNNHCSNVYKFYIENLKSMNVKELN